MKLKKTIMIILAIISAMCFAAFYACGTDGDVTVLTKEPSVVYRKGENINCFDFFERQTGVSYTFSVTYQDDSDVSVADKTFYAAKAGDYTVVCTAKRGSKTAQESAAVTVYEIAPYMVFGAETVYLDLGESMNKTVIKSFAATKWIPKYVTGYEEILGGVTIDFFDTKEDDKIYMDLTTQNDGWTIDGKTFFDGNIFTFAREGMYVFDYVLKNNGGEYTGKIEVSVQEDISDYLVLSNNAGYTNSNKTLTWQAVDGAKSYKVKTSLGYWAKTDKTFFVMTDLLDEWQYADVSIIPLNDSGEPITVDDKKTKIVVEGVAVSPEGFDNVIKSNETTVNLDTRVASLAGKGLVGAGHISQVVTVDNSYLAFTEYKVGKFMTFEFTGNNMPQMTFFANKINGNMSNYQGNATSVHSAGKAAGNTGITLMNGIEGGQKQNSTANTFSIWGPKRIYAEQNGLPVLTNSIAAHSKSALLYSKYSDGSGLYDAFTQTALEKTGNGETKYKYVVGTYVSKFDEFVHVKGTLTSADGNTVYGEFNLSLNLTVEEAEALGSYAIAFATVKGSNINSEFKYVDYKTMTVEEKFALNDGSEDNGTFTLAGKVGAGAGHVVQIGAINNSYAAFGEYSVGKYLTFEFTGNNMPQMTFFANKANSNMTNYAINNANNVFNKADGKYYDANNLNSVTNNKGITLYNGAGGEGGFIAANNATKTFSIWGPNRIFIKGDSGTTLTDNTIEIRMGANALYSYKYATGGDKNCFTQQWLNENADKEFKYVVGTYLSLDGTVHVEGTLTSKDGSTTYGTFNVSTGLTVEQAEALGDKVIAYGTIKGTAESTVFALIDYKAVNRPQETYTLNAGTYDEETKIATLEAKKAAGAGHLAQIGALNNSYIAFAEYAVGKYLTFEFTGNNMPQMTFFASKINGNMTNYAINNANNVFNNASGKYYDANNLNAVTDNKGITLYNGAEGFTGTNYDNRAFNTFSIWGPNRIVIKADSGNSISQGTLSDLMGTNAIYSYKYATSGEKNCFTQQWLNENADKEFKYVVGTYLSLDGTVHVEGTLTSIDGSTTYGTFNVSTGLTVEQAEALGDKVIAYGTIKGDTATVFKCVEYVQTDRQEQYALNDGTISGNTATLAGKSAAGAGHLAQIGDIDNSYIAFGNYTVGKYLAFEFTGNNMPQMTFFANKINGNMSNYAINNASNMFNNASGQYYDANRLNSVTDNKGITLYNGAVGFNTANTAINTFSIWGPNRIVIKADSGNSISQGIVAQHMTTNALYSYTYAASGDKNCFTQQWLNENSTTEFKYVVGTYENTDGKVYVTGTLTSKDGATQYGTFDVSTGLTVEQAEALGDKVIAYGTIKGSSNATTFTFTAPYTPVTTEA